ncbi:hypothetical protein U1Q18_045313 [Sarracenia purpurea var. burkii]
MTSSSLVPSWFSGSDSVYTPEPPSRESYGQEMITFTSQEINGSLAGSHISSSGSLPAVSQSSNAATDAPRIHDGTSRRSDGDSSQNAYTEIQSNPTSQNGISIFQGYTYYNVPLISYMTGYCKFKPGLNFY